MNELIKIIEKEGKQIVSARELYEFLGYDQSNWGRWYRKNIIENEFAVENEDYTGFVIVTNGNKTKEFALTIDFAKKLSMMAKTKKGEQARQYFIECEKKLKQQKPLSQIEILQQSINLLVEQQKQVTNHEQRIKAIEERPAINAPVEHFSILGYCHNIGMQVSLQMSQKYAWKCKKMCDDLGLNIGKISDPRFGTVNTYPLDVLKEIIS